MIVRSSIEIKKGRFKIAFCFKRKRERKKSEIIAFESIIQRIIM